MHKNHPALIIGGGINALGLIRNFGRNGIDVYCVNGKKDEATYSKYCKKYYILPEINNKEKLEIFLKKFSSSIKSDIVIFPTTDISVLNIADLKSSLQGYNIVTSDYKITETQ